MYLAPRLYPWERYRGAPWREAVPRRRCHCHQARWTSHRHFGYDVRERRELPRLRPHSVVLWAFVGGTGPVLTLPANVVGLVTAGDGPARRLDHDCGLIDAGCFAFSIGYDAVACDPVCSSFPLSSTVSVGMALSSCLGREPPKEAATAAVGVPGVVPVAASAAVRVVLPLHQRPLPAGW